MSSEGSATITIISPEISSSSTLVNHCPWGPSAAETSPFPAGQGNLCPGASLCPVALCPGGLGWLGCKEVREPSHTWDAKPGGRPLWGRVESCKGQPCGYAQCRWGSSGWSSPWCSGSCSGERCLEMGGVRTGSPKHPASPQLCKPFSLLLPVSQATMGRKHPARLGNVPDTD